MIGREPAQLRPHLRLAEGLRAGGLIQVYLVENHPWVLWSSLRFSDWQRLARRVGEWAWVGRDYG
jgi:hypothetical protein